MMNIVHKIKKVAIKNKLILYLSQNIFSCFINVIVPLQSIYVIFVLTVRKFNENMWK